jgi:hypothetical protein
METFWFKKEMKCCLHAKLSTITLILIIGNIIILLHLIHSYGQLPIYAIIIPYLVTFKLQIFYVFYRYYKAPPTVKSGISNSKLQQ